MSTPRPSTSYWDEGEVRVQKMTKQTRRRRQKTEDEKRANNAALERGRRDRMKNAYAELAAAVPEASDDISRARLLEVTAVFIKDKTQDQPIECIRRQNEKLIEQLAILEQQLASLD